MHRAALSILAGNVFPRPAFQLCWRFALLGLFARIHRHVPLVPRRERCSLLAQPASPGESAGEASPFAVRQEA